MYKYYLLGHFPQLSGEACPNNWLFKTITSVQNHLNIIELCPAMVACSFKACFPNYFLFCFSNRIKQLLENLKAFIHGKKLYTGSLSANMPLPFYLKSQIKVLNHQLLFSRTLKISKFHNMQTWNLSTSVHRQGFSGEHFIWNTVNYDKCPIATKQQEYGFTKKYLHLVSLPWTTSSGSFHPGRLNQVILPGWLYQGKTR